MIFIVVKFQVKPEKAEEWPQITKEFTEATRAEPGNKWFDWSRSLDDPNEYVLVEAFDDDAAEAHVKSDHFQKATADGGSDEQCSCINAEDHLSSDRRRRLGRNGRAAGQLS